jgi:hypothetical protein
LLFAAKNFLLPTWAMTYDTMGQVNQAFRNIVNMLHGVRDEQDHRPVGQRVRAEAGQDERRLVGALREGRLPGAFPPLHLGVCPFNLGADVPDPRPFDV